MRNNVRVAVFATGLALLAARLASAATAYYPSPQDWRDENIYQIFTDRFNNGNPSNDNAEASRGAPYTPTNSQGINGGDLQGIEQKLDYIKALGATAIWISPIPLNVPNSAYHGYGAQDFYTLAPHWGTMADLTNMVEAAHARGIKVILDVVCNHSGTLLTSSGKGWPTFVAPPGGYTLKYSNNSNQHAFPFNPSNAFPQAISSIFHTNGNIDSFSVTQQVVLGELDGLDDFRTETSYVRTNMMNIYTNWVGLADLDGFRVDTALEVDYGFWQYWCTQMHQYGASIGKSNFFMFCEAENGDDSVVGSYSGTEGGGAFKFDSTLDYALYYDINAIFATATGPTEPIEAHYDAVATDYDTNSQYRLVTFLDNHDQPRFLSSGNANNNTNRLAVALAFLYTARGIPCLYYGTEQAFNGGADPANREDMFAGQYESGPSVGDNFNETHPLFQWVAMLNNFRRLYICLREGDHNNLWNNSSGPGLFAYSRVYSNQEIFVCFNTASTSQTLTNRPTTYPAGTVIVNLLNTNETYVINSTPNTPSITVPSTTAKIFIAQSLMQPLDPVVVSQSPTHSMSNVSVSASVVLQFSKPMNTNSVQAAFSMTPPASGTFSWSAAQTTMTFTPGGLGWPGLTTNLVHLATNAFDAVSGNALYAPFDTYFVTVANTNVDTVPPTVTITTPAGNSTVAGVLPLSGTAADNVLVSTVQFNINNGDWVTATGTTSWTFPLNTGFLLNGTNTISARAIDSSGNVSAVVSVPVRIFNVPGAYQVNLSAGDPASVTDCDEMVWLQDQAYTFNSFGYSGGTTGFINNAISNVCAAAYPLLDYERYSTPASTFQYLFDCPEGVYQTTLIEAETYWSNANQRVFNVYIQGQEVLSNYDIYAAAGGMNIAVTNVFTNAVANSELAIQFSPVIDNARVSGIQVVKIADLDSDGDGIPDWWMLAYFNHPTGQAADNSLDSDDADGSGFSNLQDYLAGTDPTNPNDCFKITQIILTGNDVQVSWSTVTNRMYQLQNSPTPDSTGTWTNVGSQMPGTGGGVSQTDSGGATNTPPLFYRVQLVP